MFSWFRSKKSQAIEESKETANETLQGVEPIPEEPPKSPASPSENPRISSDAPVGSKSADRLGRIGFAARLAASLNHLPDGENYVFALQGQWGSGKSSLINLALDSLPAAGDHLIPVRFNPWWFSGSHDLATQLFSQIGASIASATSDPRWAKAKERLVAVQSYFSDLCESLYLNKVGTAASWLYHYASDYIPGAATLDKVNENRV